MVCGGDKDNLDYIALMQYGELQGVQYCNNKGLFNFGPITLFGYFNIKVFDLPPKCGWMNAHMGCGGLSVPVVFHQDIIDKTPLNAFQGYFRFLCTFRISLS